LLGEHTDNPVWQAATRTDLGDPDVGRLAEDQSALSAMILDGLRQRA